MAFETRGFPSVGTPFLGRLCFAVINRNICTPFYRALVVQTPAEQQQALGELTASLAAFTAEIKVLAALLPYGGQRQITPASRREWQT